MKSLKITCLVFVLGYAGLINATDLCLKQCKSELGVLEDYSEYLGNPETLSRWEHHRVPIAYNPENAKDSMNTEAVEALIVQAIQIIEGAAEIEFDYRGITTANAENIRDKVVTIGWKELSSSIAGHALAVQEFRDYRLGYNAYYEGYIELNSAINHDPTLHLLLHELLHVLGIGHSNNPYSIMNYSSLSFEHLLQDDIDALQALYGPPDEFISYNPLIDSEKIEDTPLLSLYPSDIGFYVTPPSGSVSAGQLISSLREESVTNPNSSIRVRFRYQGNNTNNILGIMFKDPKGNIVQTESLELAYERDWIDFYMGKVEDIFKFPGAWQVIFTLENSVIAVRDLEIISNESDNKTPDANLVVERLGDQTFRLENIAQDFEGDPISYFWHIPASGQKLNAAKSITVKGAGAAPIQVFAGVKDDVYRLHGDPSQPGQASGMGYGSIQSRWLVEPALPFTPSLFIGSNILHIPAVDLGGVMVSMNFKLTKLPGARFKLLEFDVISDNSQQPLATLNSELSELVLQSLVIVDGQKTNTMRNVRFSIEADQTPPKLTYIE